jgi:transposase InsO family protein
LQQARRRRPRRIAVSRPLDLWGADLTLVFVLGFLPVCILGALDYRGSRLVAFEPLPWPTSAAIARALGAAMDRHGAPAHLLTDRGPVFRAQAVAGLLAARGVRHVLTFPAHPWTNGRIERVFRLFKETVFSRFWLVASRRQLVRFCRDFRLWHNRDRPHGGWEGRTPDEVFFGRPVQLRPLSRVTYFDGALPCHGKQGGWACPYAAGHALAPRRRRGNDASHPEGDPRRGEAYWRERSHLAWKVK